MGDFPVPADVEDAAHDQSQRRHGREVESRREDSREYRDAPRSCFDRQLLPNAHRYLPQLQATAIAGRKTHRRMVSGPAPAAPFRAIGWAFLYVSARALLLWQAVDRVLSPIPVQGLIPIVVGITAALANWGVAQLLWKPSQNNAAIRLAYIHNIGDVWVSLAPVVAGVLLTLTGYSIFDPLMAGAIALWIIATTAREVFASRDELIWPEKIVCGHSDHEEERTTAS